MAGLPLESWMLIVASVGLGLALELAYLRAHRSEEGRAEGEGPLPRDAHRRPGSGP